MLYNIVLYNVNCINFRFWARWRNPCRSCSQSSTALQAEPTPVIGRWINFTRLANCYDVSYWPHGWELCRPANHRCYCLSWITCILVIVAWVRLWFLFHGGDAVTAGMPCPRYMCLFFLTLSLSLNVCFSFSRLVSLAAEILPCYMSVVSLLVDE